MKNRLILPVAFLIMAMTTSCESDTANKNFYHDLSQVTLLNTRISQNKDLTKKAKALETTDETPTNDESDHNLIDFKILDVSRELTFTTDVDKYIESEVPIYQLKEAGETVTDIDGNTVYQTDSEGNYILDENGNKIPEVYAEDTFVASKTMTTLKPVFDIVVDTFSSIEVKIRVLPTEYSDYTNIDLYQNALELGLLNSSSYFLHLENGDIVSPFIVRQGADTSTFILEFITLNSDDSYNEFFNVNTWGEELKDEDVNRITGFTFKNKSTQEPIEFFGDVYYEYNYIEEARDKISAKMVQEYNLLSTMPFVDLTGTEKED